MGLTIMNGESERPSVSMMMSAEGEPSIKLDGMDGNTLKLVPA